MNKQSSLYTIIYIIVMVVVVGAALAFTSLSLSSRQKDNADADKMMQILGSVNIKPEKGQVVADFNKYIVDQKVVNEAGETIGTDAFSIDMAKEWRKPVNERQLPVFVCRLADGATKYIIPVYGAGLWGPIWGYLAFDADGSTLYGVYFDHQGETPGLGAEITTPAFRNQFAGKHVLVNGQFLPIEVVKKGQQPSAPGADYVDGVTGGTITSKGVGDMINNCLTPYKQFLENVK